MNIVLIERRVRLVVGTLALFGGVSAEGLAAQSEHSGGDGRTPAAPVVADVTFLQGMLEHHAQALEMTSLVAGRAERADILMLARRIELSQEDEIARMRTLLQQRAPGSAAAGQHLHAAASHAGAAPYGMLSREEIARLAAASGAVFDALFLEMMIRHHEGALTMVAELFDTDSGGQDGEIFQIASHIDSDQRIEIERMRRMQAVR